MMMVRAKLWTECQSPPCITFVSTRGGLTVLLIWNQFRDVNVLHWFICHDMEIYRGHVEFPKCK